MPNRATRRAAVRNAAELASKANPETVTNTASPVTTAFDFTGEQDSTASADRIHAEKSFAAAAGAGTSDSGSASAPSSQPKTAQAAPISDARLAANRANAQHSSGPRTQTGKAKSSLNAVKTGQPVVLIPTDDAAAYQAHINRHLAKYSPATDDEHTLVQSIADTEWRLLRIAPLEAAVYSLGHREFLNDFDDEENPATRAGLVRAKTMLHYRRDLSNLVLQERRLRNHLEKDTAKLEALQKSRSDQRNLQIAWCVKHIDLARQQGATFDPADCGFDFSKEELQTYFDRTSTQFRLVHTRPCFDKFLATHRNGQKGAAA